MFDAVILGAGLTGLTTAIKLSKKGIKVALIEKNDFFNLTPNTRTLTLSVNSVNFYKTLGIDLNLDNCGKISTILITDHSGLNTEFKAQDINQEYMGFVVKNDDIILQLSKHINENITVFNNTKYSEIKKFDNAFEIVLTNEVIYTKTIIASDGVNSDIFDLLNFNKHLKEYNQTALMFNIHHSNKHNHIATEHFTPNGPFATLPLSDQNESTVVWSQSNDLFSAFKEENLINDMTEYCPKWLGADKIITPVLKFPLSLQTAHNYYKNGIFLLGATARNLHPLAGQAFNVIIEDLDNLCNILSLWKKESNEQKTLPLYAIKWRCNRIIDGFGMTYFTHLTNSMFSNNSGYLKIARNIALLGCNALPFIKKFLIKKGSK